MLIDWSWKTMKKGLEKMSIFILLIDYIMVVIYGSIMVHYPCGKSNIVDKCIDVRRAKVKQWQESLRSHHRKKLREVGYD